jgi:AraC family transcriptional regulator
MHERLTWRKLQDPADPLAGALAAKARTGGPGTTRGATVAVGDGWRVVDIVCTAGPGDRPFEERHEAASISLVLAGTFGYRSPRGECVLSPGALLLGTPAQSFECSHAHGEGDHCLSFQFAPALFDRLAHEAGAIRPAFACDRLPPMRALAVPTAGAFIAHRRGAAIEETAIALAGAVIRIAAEPRRNPVRAPRNGARIAAALRRMEARIADPHPLAALAAEAGMSRYQFLRGFAAATGVTPHQWLLRARLRVAAHRLATTRVPVTELALDVGFDDLSNFIRSFRAEFGMSPTRFRASS